jgi:ATP-dependent Zn protease
MREPEPPSTSGRAPGAGTGGGGRSPRALLQRLAGALAAVAALLPAWLRAAAAPRSAARLLRLLLLFCIGAAVSVFASAGARRGGARGGAPREVLYSTFLSAVERGDVRSARFEDGTGRILFDLHPAPAAAPAAAVARAGRRAAAPSPAAVEAGAAPRLARAAPPRQLYARAVPDPRLIPTLAAAGVEFGAARAGPGAGATRVLATALALWIPLVPLFLVMRRTLEGRSGGSSGKRFGGKGSGGKAAPGAKLAPPTTFADVAGVGAAKEELAEVVACLRDSRRYAALGAKLPSGVLLFGPPGTGKTLLARAVAGEAGVPFISVSASEFVEMYVGRGAARVRQLFAEARKAAPCVVFIDELDAVGGRRGAGLNEERDQTLNQLLTELDGFEGRPGVLLLAATNRPEVLDGALMRPGRLSRRVAVPLPDAPGRAAILGVHLRAAPVADPVRAAAAIARLTPGFSGAELANVVNEAAFLAARRDARSIEEGDLVEAVLRTRDGVGGGADSPLGRRLRGWLVDLASGREAPRASPLGS